MAMLSLNKNRNTRLKSTVPSVVTVAPTNNNECHNTDPEGDDAGTLSLAERGHGCKPFNLDADDDGGDNSDCDLKWDLWAKDLMHQALASSSNNIVVTITEPVLIHPSYLNKHICPTASSSTFSSVTLSEQGSQLPSNYPVQTWAFFLSIHLLSSRR